MEVDQKETMEWTTNRKTRDRDGREFVHLRRAECQETRTGTGIFWKGKGIWLMGRRTVLGSAGWRRDCWRFCLERRRTFTQRQLICEVCGGKQRDVRNESLHRSNSLVIGRSVTSESLAINLPSLKKKKLKKSEKLVYDELPPVGTRKILISLGWLLWLKQNKHTHSRG